MLTGEHPAMSIRFALAPESEIKGVVLDEAGEAVRGARVSLMRVQAAAPESLGQASPRFAAQTDDRGMYEFDGLQPGDYRLVVTAQPWYAVAAGQGRQNTGDSPPLDPSLDVAYPVTWFPGVSDPDAAETLTLKGGDVREADVHLQPVPAVHLVIDPPSTAGDNRNTRYFPIVQRVDSGMNEYVQPILRTNAQGQMDVSGLAPGLYQVQLRGTNGADMRGTVRVTSDGEQTVSFDDASNEAEVSLHLDGIPVDEANALMVSLLDPVDRQAVATTERAPVALRAGGVTPAGAMKIKDDASNAKELERTLNVPPGKYEVVIQERQDVYLAGITANGAQATGRMVALSAGASNLTLHIVEGRAMLTGFANRDSKPSVGALVLLVPATLGETGALQIVRRDESNTDGSFDMADVIPGQYILIAVEDGWEINWRDKATLTRYLTGGVAVNLAAKSRVTQNLTAQRP